MADKTATTGGSQTLDRGVRVLEALAEAGRHLSTDELAAALGVHRSIVYRLIRTLEDHSLVARDEAGRYGPGVGLAALASNVSRDLQSAAMPHLDTVANDLGVTTLLAVLLNEHEAMTLTSAAPHRHSAVVVYHPGFRHPLTRGAPGKAILVDLPRSSWPADTSAELEAEIASSRARGFTSSSDEVVRSLHAVGVPLTIPGQPRASIAVVHMALPEPDERVAERLKVAAAGIRRDLGR